MVNLAELDGGYDDIVPATEGVPKGHYQCRIDEVELAETQDAGHPMLKFKLTILSGPHQGAIWWNMIFTGAEMNMRFNKADLIKLGYMGKPSGLEEPGVLDSFLGLFIAVEVVVKPSKKRPGETDRNVRLKKQISVADIEGGYSEDDGTATQANYAPPDDDIPF